MNIAHALEVLFPDAKIMVDYMVQDDGEGQYISKWKLQAPMPSDEELKEAYSRYKPIIVKSDKERIVELEQVIDQLILDSLMGV